MLLEKNEVIREMRNFQDEMRNPPGYSDFVNQMKEINRAAEELEHANLSKWEGLKAMDSFLKGTYVVQNREIDLYKEEKARRREARLYRRKSVLNNPQKE